MGTCGYIVPGTSIDLLAGLLSLSLNTTLTLSSGDGDPLLEGGLFPDPGIDMLS